MRTPEYKSRYCSEHKIRACNFSLLATQEHEDDKEGTYVTAPNRMKYYLSSNEGSILPKIALRTPKLHASPYWNIEEAIP